MSTHSGFLYYYDLLGLDPESYRMHYRFDEQASASIPNVATLYPALSGAGSRSTTGDFSNNKITISGATGIGENEWTHLFILDRKSPNKGVVFDSLESGARWSGYRIGVNDNNQVFLECRGQFGPLSFTSNLPTATKNIYAVVKSNNLVTFYNYDFYNAEVNSSSNQVDGTFFPYSSFGTIGSGRDFGGQYAVGNLSGIIKDYIFLSDSISPQAFKLLCSGLASSVTVSSGPVTSFSGVEITGYSTGITGTTGIVRYETAITGSGLNPFGTGDYIYQYGPSGITGYLSSGTSITQLTGYVTRYITGASTSGVAANQNFIDSFRYDEISVLAELSSEDSLTSNYNWSATERNLQGEFDDVNGAFSLPEEESEYNIPVFINGILQLATGYLITGDLYNSGVYLSGDFRLDGRLLDSTGYYSLGDYLFYDRSSSSASSYLATGLNSGTVIPLPASGELYLNGVLLSSGVDYTGSSSSYIISSRLSGVTGRMVFWPLESGDSIRTGASSLSGSFWAGAQKIWMNGVRLANNIDYKENSSLDLLKTTGTLEVPTGSIFINQENFFE